MQRANKPKVSVYNLTNKRKKKYKLIQNQAILFNCCVCPAYAGHTPKAFQIVQKYKFGLQKLIFGVLFFQRVQVPYERIETPNRQHVARWFIVRQALKEAKRQNPVLTNRNVIRGKLKRISVHSNATSKVYQNFNLQMTQALEEGKSIYQGRSWRLRVNRAKKSAEVIVLEGKRDANRYRIGLTNKEGLNVNLQEIRLGKLSQPSLKVNYGQLKRCKELLIDDLRTAEYVTRTLGGVRGALRQFLAEPSTRLCDRPFFYFILFTFSSVII